MAAIEHIEMFCGSLFIYNCKYDFRQQAIIDKISKNEKAINERFNAGDYFGFLMRKSKSRSIWRHNSI